MYKLSARSKIGTIPLCTIFFDVIGRSPPKENPDHVHACRPGVTSRHHYNATHQQLLGQMGTYMIWSRHQADGKQAENKIRFRELPPPPWTLPWDVRKIEQLREENEDNKEFSHKLDIYQQSFYTSRSNGVRPPLFLCFCELVPRSRASCLHSLSYSWQSWVMSVIDVETGKNGWYR